METLADAAGWLFGWLLRNSAHASVLALAVLVVEWVAGRRLAPRWRFGLWLLVLARLIIPVAPESPLSLFNLVDLAPAGLADAALQVLRLPAPVALPALEPQHPLVDTPVWFIGALAIWFPGALVLAAMVWRDHRRLQRALASTSPILDCAVLDLLRQSRAVMAVQQRVVVVETGEITSPAISGCWRPRLLLPYGLLARLSPDETRFLFLHELAHVKRADIAFNWVLACLQVLHWFNPVIWLALRRLLSVREEVCDDLVLRRSFPGAGREYGLTLLRILEECAPRRVIPALAGILDDVRSLRQRIRWIRDFAEQDPNPWFPAGMTVAIAIAGLTERVPDPWFWQHLRPAQPSPTVLATSATSTPAAPATAKARPTSHPTETVPASDERPDLASRVLQAFTAAMYRAAGEILPPQTQKTAPRSPTPGTTTPGTQAPTVLSRSPSTIGPKTVVPIATSQVAQRSAAGSPYSLPPIGQRGSVLDPPRQPAFPTTRELPSGRAAEVVPYFGRQAAVTPSTRRHAGG